jgi:hypothetical protein
MFKTVLIKSGSNSSERFLSIPDIVDMMFYYGEVHVVVSQFELKQLINVFGEDVLYELLTTKRLIMHPCDQHIGAAQQGGFDSVGLFKHNFKSKEELLMNFHKVVSDDPKENRRFADRFSKVLDVYSYPNSINDSLYQDVENADLLSRTTQVFVKQYYPEYRGINEIEVKAIPASKAFMSFYRIEGNLRIDEMNKLHKSLGYVGNFAYSTILMALGETNTDCFLASELNAEMITNQRWSEVYKLRMNECIQKAEQSKQNINHFTEMVSNEYLSPGQSFESGIISSVELLKDLNSRDSVKFREWLMGLPDGQPITSELYKEIQGQNSNKPWVKLARSFTQLIGGVINPIVGGGLTFLDGFVGDKIVNGWKPTIFVSNKLNKEKYRK